MEYMSKQFKFHYTSRYNISGKIQNIITPPSVYTVHCTVCNKHHINLNYYINKVYLSPCVHFVKQFQLFTRERRSGKYYKAEK